MNIKKDKNYTLEDMMISFRALTPLLLIVCTSLVGYLVIKIDENTKALRDVEKSFAAMNADMINKGERIVRLERLFDQEYNNLRIR